MKLLSIGNSFSQDAHGFLHNMFKSVGVDVHNVNACVAGCSLGMHWDFWNNDEKVYLFEEKGVLKKHTTFKEALNAEKWDVITLQQVSHYSGKYETYQPFLVDLYREIKAICPDAKFYIHKTWAYEYDFVSSNFEMYNSDQKYMYECVCDANKKAAESINVDVIPAGDVIQYLRENTKEFDYKNGGISFNRDGFHLTLDYGRYAASLTWCCKLLGVDAFDVKFIPADCDENLINKIKKAVNAVLKGE
ncbi:MAG: DUF4886 domain-containing protein [Clostridia bacterium]|nr:DUF4886 domain-containing protein [Clostridia bacterium]